MKVGIALDLRTAGSDTAAVVRRYQFTLELIEEAERLGIESVWLSEHHGFDDSYLSQPLAFAAAVAARTSTIRIGTGVVIAPFRSAPLLAEEAALVDVLSNGRLEVGLGAGYLPHEFDLYDVDLAQRYRLTDERVSEMRRLWASVELSPHTVQSRVPVWLGYNGPQGARRAGLLGEGLLSLNPTLLSHYHDGLREGGHGVDSARMSGILQVFASDDPDRDWPVVREAHRHQWQSYRDMLSRHSGDQVRPFDPDRSRTHQLSQRMGDLWLDTPENLAAGITELTRLLPAERVIVWVSPGALAEDASVNHLNAIATQLRPLLASGTKLE